MTSTSPASSTIHSMTAFARCEANGEWGVLSIEIRSVNHRYLDVSMRMPEDVRVLESKLRSLLTSKVNRGKVEVNIRINPNPNAPASININTELAEAVSKQSREVEHLLYNPAAVSPLEVMRWPGVIIPNTIDISALHKATRELLDEVIIDFKATRQREGEKLAAMLEQRCAGMVKIVSDTALMIPDILNARREKLLARFAELKLDIDHNRIEQEMVMLAQKLDVEEELDRLTAHIEEIRRVLTQTEPVGRRLDFLMQELNREANTLGSKSIDTQTTKASVDLKVLIEQMREQVQNIE